MHFPEEGPHQPIERSRSHVSHRSQANKNKNCGGHANWPPKGEKCTAEMGIVDTNWYKHLERGASTL